MKYVLALTPATLLLCINFTEFMRVLYLRAPDVDILMHMLGGMCIAFMAFVLVQDQGWWHAMPALWRIALLVGCALIFGTMWEWYEFLSDVFFGTHNQPSLADTMKDFFNDTAGAVFFAMVAFSYEGLRK